MPPVMQDYVKTKISPHLNIPTYSASVFICIRKFVTITADVHSGGPNQCHGD